MLRATIILSIACAGIIMIENEAAARGLYIEEEITNTMTGAKTVSTKKMYYTENSVLIDDETLPYNVLFHITKNRVYLIDNKNKQYSKTSIEEFKKLSGGAFSSLNDNDIIIKNTGRKKKIGGYNCFEIKIIINKLGLRTSSWLSSGIVSSLEPYFAFSKKTGLGAGTKKVLDLMKKHKAYTVESITTRIDSRPDPGSIIIRLKDISNRKIPERMFRVPDGYKEVPVR